MNFPLPQLFSDSILLVLLQFSLLLGAVIVLARLFSRSAAIRNCILFTSLICTFVVPFVWILSDCTGYSLNIPVTQADPPRVVTEAPIPLAPSMSTLEPLPETEFLPNEEIASQDQFLESFVFQHELPPEASPNATITPEPFADINETYSTESLLEFSTAQANASPEYLSPETLLAKAKPAPLITIRTGLGIVWFGGALCTLIGLMISVWRLHHLLGSIKPVDRSKYQYAMDQAAKNLGIAQYPQLGSSHLIQTPVAVCLFRSAWVLIPRRYLEVISTEQLVQVLTHEGAHIIRRDPQVRLIQRLSVALWWWHPLVHLLNRQLSRAREEVCDNFVLNRIEPTVYGTTLLELGKLVSRKKNRFATVGLFGSSWKLEHRIKGLLNPGRSTMTQVNKGVFTLILTATIAVTAITGATRIQAQESDERAERRRERVERTERDAREQRAEREAQAARQVQQRAERARQQALEMAEKAQRRAVEQSDRAAQQAAVERRSRQSREARDAGQALRASRGQIEHMAVAMKHLQEAGMESLVKQVERQIARRTEELKRAERELEKQMQDKRRAMEQELRNQESRVRGEYEKARRDAERLAAEREKALTQRRSRDAEAQRQNDARNRARGSRSSRDNADSNDEFQREVIGAIRELNSAVNELRAEMKQLKKDRD